MDIDPASDPDIQPGSATSLNGYRLAWSDEFNGTAVDETKWKYREGDDSRSFVKSFQTAANNSVSGGVYRCILKKETKGTKEFTAGGLISARRMRYGYYESRFRCPPTGGWHTSFWMMPYKASESPVIELDVFENDSIDLFDYSVNVHRWKPEPHVMFGTRKIETPNLSASFHILGCEYTPDEVRYYFDGTVVQTVDATQFEQGDMNIWLTSLGLVYDGQPAIDESQLPVEAQYDYVRYFELGPHATVEIVSPGSGGATLTDTNTAVVLQAAVTAVNTGAVPTVIWSKQSGPGSVIFDDISSTNTGVRFSADGYYEIMCSAIIGNVTNSDSVAIAVNAPLSVTLRNGTDGYEHDATFIREDYPDVNSGADNELIVGRWGGGALRSLLEFDLSGLDPEAVIQSAELTLYNYGGVGAVGDMELRELSTSFIEGTGDGGGWSDGNGDGSGATWFSRTGSQNWITAGGDFYPTLLSSHPGYDASEAGYKTFPSSSFFVDSAQAALDSVSPLKLIISSPETESSPDGKMSRFRSDDASSADERPALTVSYLGRFLPEVYAGPDLTGIINRPVVLQGRADHVDEVEWRMVSGPASVNFTDIHALTNTALFGTPGRYRLRLAGIGTRGSGYQDISVSIVDEPPVFHEAERVGDAYVFEVGTITGLTYTLQHSDNLMADRWTDLCTTNAETDPIFFEPPVSTNRTGFYRVILEP
ncbi:DNRLRE domain-containing protein [Pontiella agarivorans]|uniref:Family 16 glycosylhydrolase n=1 Tax=Pontiella agarivorans TaxID=3038953 RepID=A0ABU5MWE5_9BACT|nr:DNRLRE domain-containing protein [Pontiella agarivorans]MDZ8118442.1 family 16 glycosylhydrolase [Pontiella agarivorans]